ncbi:MAG: heavy-metal-associated domain-containing protein [Phycisphaerae bacterium]
MFGSSPPPSASGDDAGLAVAAFHIEGMTCEGCAVNLKNALSKLPGAIIANVDYLTRTAVVRYDPTKPVPPEEIIEAVKAAGYQVQLNGASP